MNKIKQNLEKDEKKIKVNTASDTKEITKLKENLKWIMSLN